MGDTECSVGIIQCLRLCALWLLNVHPKQGLQHHHPLPHPLAKVPHIYIFASMYTFVYIACICMYMHVEARGQTWMSFHRCYLSDFFLAFICNGLVDRHIQAIVHVWSSGDNLQCSLLFSCHVGHRDGAQVMRLESKHLYSLVNLPDSCSTFFFFFWTRTLTDPRPVK